MESGYYWFDYLTVNGETANHPFVALYNAKNNTFQMCGCPYDTPYETDQFIMIVKCIL
jgi:hypothetical protein